MTVIIIMSPMLCRHVRVALTLFIIAALALPLSASTTGGSYWP